MRKLNEGEKRLIEFMFQISGGFYTDFFKCAMKADTFNKAKLAKGFPEEIEALKRYQNEIGYWDEIQEIYKNNK